MNKLVRSLILVLTLTIPTFTAIAEDPVEFCYGVDANCCPGSSFELCAARCINNSCQPAKSTGEKCSSSAECLFGYCEMQLGDNLGVGFVRKSLGAIFRLVAVQQIVVAVEANTIVPRKIVRLLCVRQ